MTTTPIAKLERHVNEQLDAREAENERLTATVQMMCSKCRQNAHRRALEPKP